jgi:hypothetical protein
VIRLEAGPFNGPDDSDASMTWVDITAWVNDNMQTVTTSEGRQTELAQVDPGMLTFLLNNQDHRFTPGNPLSPYSPGWRTGMRIRLRETLGYQTYTYFDGNLLQPDMTIQTPGLDQTVTVSATDRLGRLATSRTFTSTLAEHIRYNGGAGLKAYYPLGETRPGGFRDLVGGYAPMTIGSGSAVTGTTALTTPLVTPGGGATVPGDDLRGVLLSPLLDANQLLTSSLALTVTWPTPIPQVSGETMTVAAWIMLNNATRDLLAPIALTGQQLTIGYNRSTSPLLAWTVDAQTGTGPPSAVSLAAPPPPGPAALIALRVTLPSGLVEIWPHTAPIVTGTLTGSPPPTAAGWSRLTVGRYMAGTIDHVQVYVGSAAYTYPMHLAQAAAGMTGLAGQYTGDRIRTIARYAGVADGDMDIDPGTSRMQAVSLAGKSPLSVMQEAATTEQGLLHTRGRRVLFHDRLRRYNR